MTLDELLEIRPVDPEIIRQGVEEMKAEARLYQLRELRKDVGLTQAQVAKRLGVSQHRVSQIENGDLPNVKIDTLKKYLEALGTSINISVESPNGQSFKLLTSA